MRFALTKKVVICIYVKKLIKLGNYFITDCQKVNNRLIFIVVVIGIRIRVNKIFFVGRNFFVILANEFNHFVEKVISLTLVVCHPHEHGEVLFETIPTSVR